MDVQEGTITALSGEAAAAAESIAVDVTPLVESTQTVEMGGSSRTAITTSNDWSGLSRGEDDVAELLMPKKFAESDNPQEALLKSYLELQKKQSEGAPADAQTLQQEPAKETEVKPTEDTKEEGGIGDKYTNLWETQGGKLEDSQWQELADKTGFDMETLKHYEQLEVSRRAGAVEEANNTITAEDKQIFDASGGEADYNKMIDWASENLTEAQQAGLNARLDEPTLAVGAVEALKSLYVESEGKEASVGRDVGTVAEELGADDFHSEADILRAQKDPRYGHDDFYDKELNRKLMKWMKQTGS